MARREFPDQRGEEEQNGKKRRERRQTDRDRQREGREYSNYMSTQLRKSEFKIAIKYNYDMFIILP